MALLAALALSPSASAQPLPAAAIPSPRPTIVSVAVHLPPGYEPERFAALVTVHAGEPLSRDAVRDSIERLYATNQFADVVVRMAPRGRGVALSFDAVAQKRVVQVSFLGNVALRPSELLLLVLQACGEDAGGPGATPSLPVPYFSEAVEAMRAAVEQGYAERGYQSARVVAKVEELGPMEVQLELTIDEGPPTRVAAISAAGDPKLAPEDLADAVGIHVGDILARAALDAGIKRLRAYYQKAQHYRAHVGAPEVVHLPAPGERAAVAFPVRAGPQIRFHFHGNASFPEQRLEAVLGYSPEDALDDAEEERMAERVRSFYQLKGFYDARVQPEEVWSPDRNRLVIIFAVDEGRPLAVKQIRFQGNAHFTDAFLRARVRESLRDAVPEPTAFGTSGLREASAAVRGSEPVAAGEQVRQYDVPPISIYADKPYREATARMVELYRADGFLRASVDPPALDIDERARTAVVTVRVQEGPQTRVAGVDLTGVPHPREWSRFSTLQPGQPFSTFEEENTRLAVVRELQRRGYLYARTEDEERFSPDEKQAWVVYEVTLGPRVRVGRVIIKGNEITREHVIRSALALREGDPFDPEKVAQTQRNLASLGIFQRVSLGPLDPDHVDKEKDLVVEVDERPRTDIVASAGASLIDGPRVYVEANRANLLGLGLELTGQAKINYFNWSYPVLSASPVFSGGGADQLKPQPGIKGFGGHVNAGLRDPRIFFLEPLQIDAHLDGVAERVNRPAYNFTRFAAIAGSDWQIARWLSASLNYSIESDDIHKQAGLEQIITVLSQSDLQRLRFEEGQTYLHGIAPTLTLDLRDNAASPHAGLLVSASSELAHDLGGEFTIYYWKPWVTATGYVPLGSRVVLALSARGGRIFPLDPNSHTIPPKRFYLGGGSSLRGYAEDGLTPEDRRDDLHVQVAECRALANSVGCTEAARVLLGGSQLPSEGGEAFTLYKAELRFPIFGDVGGAIFADAGDLWLDPTHFTLAPRALRLGTGVGIRWNTPVGPLVFDVGVNPNPDPVLDEGLLSFRQVYFSIGQF